MNTVLCTSSTKMRLPHVKLVQQCRPWESTTIPCRPALQACQQEDLFPVSLPATPTTVWASAPRAHSQTAGTEEGVITATPANTSGTGAGSDVETAPSQAGDLSIICVSDLIWDEHWSSEQQLMSRLCKRCRVLYVERPVSLLSFFTGLSDASIGRQFWRFFRGGLRHAPNTPVILTLPPVLPLRFLRLTNRINEWIRRRSIRRAVKKLGLQNFVLWIYSPEAGRLVGTLGEQSSLYYCADDWAAFDQWWNRPNDVRAREEELAAKVNLIVGTSTKLVAKWRSKYNAVQLVTNGADVKAFKQARDSQVQEPADLAGIPHPRIGYVGFIDDRFNTALYEAMCASRPDWQFVIIGPLVEGNLDLKPLRQMKHVHFLGPRQRADLPLYLKGLDVCTIPYIVNTLSESIFPLKLFEYIAAGRQVVATALPELLPFSSYIRIAETPGEFLSHVALNLSDPLPVATEAFLEAHSWDSKADLLWHTVQQMVKAPARALTKER